MNEIKVANYLEEVRQGLHPYMTPEDIYHELSGLTVRELCEELALALDVLNYIAYKGTA